MEAPREPVKARSDGRAEQRRRREDVLARQKSRRASALALSRGLLAGEEPAAPVEQPVASADDAMETTGAPAKKVSLVDGLMKAEWMVDVPSDLAERWYVAARPAGRRCLVVATGGLTKAYARGGRPRAFPSALPNGSRASRAGMSTCELDCIWREAEQTYYVLDVLAWKGQQLADCTTEFRLYWLRTKLAEARAMETTSRNPCRFVPLDYSDCPAASLRQAYAGPVAAEDVTMGAASFPPSSDVSVATAMDAEDDDDGMAGAAHTAVASNRAAEGGGGGSFRTSSTAWRDGLLFLHRDALYEAGPSPLLLSWSDAHCSSRFYDYGTERMDQAIAADPSKASKWRTEEVEAAVSFEEVLQAVATPAMTIT